VFFQKDSGLRPPEPPWNMRAAMVLVAALCILLGVFYEPLYRLLPYPVNYQPYTGFHVVAQLQLLLFSGLAFFVMLSWLRRTLTVSLDFDWFYRVLFAQLFRLSGDALGRTIASAESAAGRGRQGIAARARLLHGPRGLFARTWPSGAMGLGVMLMLLAFLLSYYLF
jgi:multicomponent Na+:H+ antiporter subunit D